ANGARLLGAFISEHAENTFPRLPVRSAENVFLGVIGFDHEDARRRSQTALAALPAWQAFRGGAQADQTRPTETLRLSPTSRSLLG
ncbi:MAG: NIPSNAP family protein, partial [Mesorhizobium sp.]